MHMLMCIHGLDLAPPFLHAPTPLVFAVPCLNANMRPSEVGQIVHTSHLASLRTISLYCPAGLQPANNPFSKFHNAICISWCTQNDCHQHHINRWAGSRSPTARVHRRG